MTVFFFFILTQICILLFFNLKYFIRCRDYNTLIPICTQISVITLAVFISKNKTGTNYMVELIIVTLGIIIPVIFILFDKPLLKKKMTFKNVDPFKNKKQEETKNVTTAIEPLQITPEKSNGVILYNLRSRDFFAAMEDKLNYSTKMIEKGHLEEALKVYEIYNETIFDINLSYNYGNLLYRTCDYERALIAYSRALEVLENRSLDKKNKEDVKKDANSEDTNFLEETKKELLVNMANTYYMLGNHQESLNCYQKVIGMDIDYKPALDNYIQVLVSIKNFDEAVRCCKNLCEKGQNYKYHFMLAKIYFELNKSDKCIKELQKSLKLKRNHKDSMVLLAEVYSSIDRLDDAIEVFTKLVKVCPEDSSIHYSFGKMLSLNGNHEEAIQRFNFAINLNPGMFEAYYNVGLSYEKIGDNEQAILTYKKLIEVKPDFISGYTKLWDIISKENRFLDLVEVCRSGIEKCPDEYILHFYLGVALSKMGRHEEALDAFKSVLDINPDMKGVNLYLGITLTKLKKYEEAIFLFRDALLDTPEDNEIFYNMSITYCLQQRYDKALVSLKKAVELNPEIKTKVTDNIIFNCLQEAEEYKSLVLK